MRIRLPRGRDFWAGVMFIGFGVVALVVGIDYPRGTAMRMGPGYLPVALAAILTLLGLAIAIQGVLAEGGPVGGLALRPLVVILAAVVAFALLLRPLGLVVATTALVAISALAGWQVRLRTVITLCVVLSALAVAIFVHGLGLPFPVWPR